MKKLLISIALFASPLLAMAGTQVGVSINIGQPDYYGQIQIGNAPPPVIYSSPVIIQAAPGVVYPPLYLRVPPAQYRNWGYYCRGYSACNRPVYFVNDNWYRHTYVPQYRHQHYSRPNYGYGYYRPPDRDHHDHREHYDNDRNKHYDRGHRPDHLNHDRRSH